MNLLVLSCIWLAIVAWLIARALGQRGLLQPLVPVTAPSAERAPRVAVIVPARDEEANIGRCLTSMARQAYPADRLRIVAIDDHSADTTAAIITAMAAEDDRISLLHSPPLPPRWVGKCHACWIGARAVAADTEWLCFIDADVWCEPPLVASAVAAAQAQDLHLLSLTPRQELHSFAERLVLPCGLYLLAFCQDLRQVQSPHTSDATATGQFILMRRDVYETVGGHAAVCGEICEDLKLAQLVKRGGGRVILQDGSALLATRMYTGWSTLWTGISKNLSEMLRGQKRTAILAAVAVVLAWAAVLVPAADAGACSQGAPLACWALIPGALASAAAFGLHIAGASYFRVPFWYGLLFPLGYSAGALMAFDSIRRRWRGRVSWKGRTYP